MKQYSGIIDMHMKMRKFLDEFFPSTTKVTFHLEDKSSFDMSFPKQEELNLYGENNEKHSSSNLESSCY